MKNHTKIKKKKEKDKITLFWFVEGNVLTTKWDEKGFDTKAIMRCASTIK